ncbi:MAG: hypothetical protein KDG50_03045 [Chromatiales bacterium]|nr:hypothetical protein [Chromatiales bacterium]
MHALNFSPPYEPYLLDGSKTTTLRAANVHGLVVGDHVRITLGWPDGPRRELGHARLVMANECRIDTLTTDDLRGESPDCRSPEMARRVLAQIYQRDFSGDDRVWLLRFEWLPATP